MKLNKQWINKFDPCEEGIEWLEAQDERDGVKIVKKLIKENKLDWANWTIVTLMKRKQYLRYAIYAAEQVIDIFEKKYPKDDRPRKAIETAKAVVKKDSKSNRKKADATRAAAGYAAGYAAWTACWDAAWTAAGDAMQTKILRYALKLLEGSNG